MASRLGRKLGGAFLFEEMVGLVTLRCKLLKLKGTKRKAEIPNPIPRVNQQKVAENGPAGAEGEDETAEDGNGEIAKGKSRGRGGGGKGAGRGRGKGGRPPAAAANAAEGELKAKLLSKLMGNTS